MILKISIFYTLTWFFLMLLGGTQSATGLLPPEIGLAQWGPGIAALLMLAIFRKEGFKVHFFSSKIPVKRYALALLPLAVGLIVYLISSLFPIQSTPSSGIFDNLPLVLLWMPLGALGEELGWRGYLHKKLDMRMRGLASSLLVGLLWMPIHIHFLTQGPVFLFFLMILFFSYSIVLYALVQDTGFNVILATVFHLAVNLSNLPLLGVIYETEFMMINALTWGAVATIVIMKNRKLFFAPRE